MCSHLAWQGIGLLCDESTDISVTKELILCARILHGKEVKAHFFKLILISKNNRKGYDRIL